MSNNFQPIGLVPNTPQLRSILNPADIMVELLPRGVGKSTSIALRMITLAEQMPRSANGLGGSTFMQLQTRTLPGTIAALEKLNYFEGIHYVIGRPHPKPNWIGPYQKPVGKAGYDHVISWHNGSIFPLISQDRAGMSRGLNLDSFTGDEAITLKEQQYKEEISPTVRANISKGKSIYNCPLALSKHFLSSKPIGFQGKWLLDYGNYYDELGLNYTKRHEDLVNIQLAFIDAKSRTEREKLWKEFLRQKAEIKYFTHHSDQEGEGSVFYQEATVFDNIMNLGWKYVMSNRRDLSDLQFLIELLNKTLQKISGSFYAAFDRDKHCYDSFDYSYLDKFNFNVEYAKKTDNCLADGDVLRHEPLHVACDYNAAINTLVVGQLQFDDSIRMLNGLHVTAPSRLKDNAKQFCDYYNAHSNKEVWFYFNNTAIAEDASGNQTFADEYAHILRDNGWTVKMVYVGQAWSHMYLYNFLGKLFMGDSQLPKITFNAHRCNDLIVSMEMAPVKQKEKEFAKDKASERSKLVKPEHATHYSEAFDTLMQGVFTQVIQKKRFIPMLVG
jgi:hypothetical protein